MSYVVEVRRPIKIQELLVELGKDAAFQVLRQDADTLEFEWVSGESSTQADFRKGIVSTTSPSDEAFQMLSQLADRLGAEIVGEEDLVPLAYAEVRRGIFSNRSTWIGWPVLVLVLAGLLVWRW
jgi:hypothetical protein